MNLATVSLFLKGASRSTDFVRDLPTIAANTLGRKGLTKSERWLAQWILGLTDKSVQNVLRDNPAALAEYRDRHVQTCAEIIDSHTREYGELTGTLTLSSGVKAQVDWLMMTYLLNTVGAQTLTLRGSDKSTYGKLFEKLILGSLLTVLGFEHVSSMETTAASRVFWLTSRADKRESDATLLYEAGKGIRFDIGFIGRGNTEISLDKVSRFEREIEVGRTTHYLATFIIVDRIGSRSRLPRLAEAIDGTIIQMSASCWPQAVAHALNERIGFQHELVDMEHHQIESYLEHQMSQVPLEEFIRLHSSE